MPVQDGPICESDPYPRYSPGEYEVRCLEAKIYRDPRIRRWVCRLRCALVLDPEREVYGFPNLGTGEKPKAGRGSKYWRYWVIANGSPPRKRQIMSTRIFKDKIFLVRVGTVEDRSDGSKHLESEKYSTIQEILEKRWP
jgi:hypothetical protein